MASLIGFKIVDVSNQVLFLEKKGRLKSDFIAIDLLNDGQYVAIMAMKEDLSKPLMRMWYFAHMKESLIKKRSHE